MRGREGRGSMEEGRGRDGRRSEEGERDRDGRGVGREEGVGMEGKYGGIKK